jgi:hypothetical protein
MSEEGVAAAGSGGPGVNDASAPAVTYRPFELADKDTPGLNVFEKGDDDKPKDPLTPLTAEVIAKITAENMADYVVEDAPVAPVLDDSTAAPQKNAAAAANPDLVAEGIPVAQAILNGLKDRAQAGSGRRRSRRRAGKKSAKKSAKKSKKVGARKSKKSGRSRKNGSKRRAHRKH